MQFVLQQTKEKCTIQTIHKNIIVTVIEGILGLFATRSTAKTETDMVEALQCTSSLH